MLLQILRKSCGGAKVRASEMGGGAPTGAIAPGESGGLGGGAPRGAPPPGAPPPPGQPWGEKGHASPPPSPPLAGRTRTQRAHSCFCGPKGKWRRGQWHVYDYGGFTEERGTRRASGLTTGRETFVTSGQQLQQIVALADQTMQRHQTALSETVARLPHTHPVNL